MSKWNGKRFSIYTSDEETVLGVINELAQENNLVTKELDEINKVLEEKTELYGDHKGTWQGLSYPTLSEEGMRATVEDIIDNKIPAIETSLDNKVNKTDKLSMANMGQDIKEAMTGGSVAVVGNHMVNNLNINEGQITPDKLSYKVTIAKTQLDIYEKDKYIDNDGVIHAMSGWNIRKINIPMTCKTIKLVTGETLALKGVIIKNDKTYSIEKNKIFDTKLLSPNCIILLNEHIGVNDGIINVELEFFKKGYTNEKEYHLINENNYQGNGIIKNNIVDTASSFWGFARFKVNIDSNFEYQGSLSAINGLLGCCYDKGENYIGDITKSNNKLVFQEQTSYIIINIGVDDTLYSTKKTTATTSTTINFKYGSCLNKPYNFSNKTALFFGDSITKGYINGSTITNKTYCKIFSDKVGLTHTNKAIGGALFTRGFNSVETITETIKNTTLNTNYIFIAGGTNDYGLGVPVETFKNSLEEVCQYLQSNYTGEVIFITPINRIAPSDDEKAPLQTYRNIIIEKACKYNYSVVDTSEFAFPISSNTYSTLVIPDNLHPSEKGYEIYAKCLLTKLL